MNGKTSIDLLLNHGANVNEKDKHGKTPLMYAGVNKRQNVVKTLLNYGAIVNEKDKYGVSAIGYAYQEKSWEAISSLLMRGAEFQPYIHDMVVHAEFANDFESIYQKDHSIAQFKDKAGRKVLDVACTACRAITLFVGRYEFDPKPKYESKTCKVYTGYDYHSKDENDEPMGVALKFIASKEHFESEVNARRDIHGNSRFSSEYVTADLESYSAENNPEYAEACIAWKMHPYCVVLEVGERSLHEVIGSENLEEKDLETRSILKSLCLCLDYMHSKEFVHGDVKPRNFLRHGGNAWKLIDFDACTKFGDKVGKKLSTAFLPPEMIRKVQDGNSNEGSMIDILAYETKGIKESDLIGADSSFDAWSFGMTMYLLVTGQSFFHTNNHDNLVNVKDLASLTDDIIRSKLEVVADANARVLLSSILRINPMERLTMKQIAADHYFNLHHVPQGRKAEPLLKPTFAQRDRNQANESIDTDDESNFEVFSANPGNQVSFFHLQDQDSDWNDMALQSEMRHFDFDELKPMGRKPELIDGDSIYQNDSLARLLLEKGPEIFMGLFVSYFQLYEIMRMAQTICTDIKANLVGNVKSLDGCFVKLFVRGKGLNDIVRGTLFCDSLIQFQYVARELEKHFDVYMKPPKKEKGSWPVPKLLVYSKNRRIAGRCISVEIQFSTAYVHIAKQISSSHKVYEAMREATDYMGERKDDKMFQGIVHKLDKEYAFTQGFVKQKERDFGNFEILPEEGIKKLKSSSTGLISSGLMKCHDCVFELLAPTEYLQEFSPSSYVVDNNFTPLSLHSYWSKECYNLIGKTVQYVVSFSGRGTIIAGIGTKKCLASEEESDDEGNEVLSISLNRAMFQLRKNGENVMKKKKLLSAQDKAKLSIHVNEEGKVVVSFVASDRPENGENEEIFVMTPSSKHYHIFIRAPAGVHDVKYHNVDIDSHNP